MLKLMESYEGISVMSTGRADQCTNTTDSRSSSAVTSSLLGQLTSSVSGVKVKHEAPAKSVFVVTNRSQINALQVPTYIQTLLFLLLTLRLFHFPTDRFYTSHADW